MTKKSTPRKKERRPLTPEEEHRAQRLNAIWKRKARGLGLTQEWVALKLGWANNTAVGQYLNGKIPLNVEAALKLAAVLDVSPMEFWPEIFDKVLPPSIAKLLSLAFAMPEDKRRSTLSYAEFESREVTGEKSLKKA